ncbi:uncharacterized protein [Diadema antillarum]|uniref:uncharacterized protein n=1 Tax=Diadema antillarum TaxID=105358 RepID=UPI003A849520
MFPCTIENCSASFNKKWKLIEHVAKHTGEKPFKCTHSGCTKSFTRQPHLQRHLGSHSNVKGFLCEEEGCGGAFSSKDSLKKHIQRVHRGRQFKCECDGCGKTFHKHQHLTVHQYVHTNIKPYKCEHEGCEARFLIPSKLKAHMKVHEGYTCTQDGCEAWFSKWSELRAHIAAHVTEFRCEKCGKVFTKKYRLKSHSKVHKEERDAFVCPRDNCERRFMKMESLQLHIRNYHEGARPFSCSYSGCTKTFSYKKSLVQHQVVHKPGYKKPPAKPRKRRSLASRLSGYADAEMSESLSPSSVTSHDPAGLNPPGKSNADRGIPASPPPPPSPVSMETASRLQPRESQEQLRETELEIQAASDPADLSPPDKSNADNRMILESPLPPSTVSMATASRLQPRESQEQLRETESKIQAASDPAGLSPQNKSNADNGMTPESPTRPPSTVPMASASKLQPQELQEQMQVAEFKNGSASACPLTKVAPTNTASTSNDTTGTRLRRQRERNTRHRRKAQLEPEVGIDDCAAAQILLAMQNADIRDYAGFLSNHERFDCHKAKHEVTVKNGC